jgi:UDP-N-acetylmuramoyl-tripeptide--D-alanyl-D-alanine ligase
MSLRISGQPTVIVSDAQAALQALAAHVVARLRDGLTVVGLTGSQGKTSTKDALPLVGAHQAHNAGDVVLVRASRGARLDEVAAALA